MTDFKAQVVDYFLEQLGTFFEPEKLRNHLETCDDLNLKNPPLWYALFVPITKQNLQRLAHYCDYALIKDTRERFLRTLHTSIIELVLSYCENKSKEESLHLLANLAKYFHTSIIKGPFFQDLFDRLSKRLAGHLITFLAYIPAYPSPGKNVSSARPHRYESVILNLIYANCTEKFNPNKELTFVEEAREIFQKFISYYSFKHVVYIFNRLVTSALPTVYIGWLWYFFGCYIREGNFDIDDKTVDEILTIMVKKRFISYFLKRSDYKDSDWTTTCGINIFNLLVYVGRFDFGDKLTRTPFLLETVAATKVKQLLYNLIFPYRHLNLIQENPNLASKQFKSEARTLMLCNKRLQNRREISLPKNLLNIVNTYLCYNDNNRRFNLQYLKLLCCKGLMAERAEWDHSKRVKYTINKRLPIKYIGKRNFLLNMCLTEIEKDKFTRNTVRNLKMLMSNSILDNNLSPKAYREAIKSKGLVLRSNKNTLQFLCRYYINNYPKTIKLDGINCPDLYYKDLMEFKDLVKKFNNEQEDTDDLEVKMMLRPIKKRRITFHF